MGFLEKLKAIIPVSSRSFHSFWVEQSHRMDALQASVESLNSLHEEVSTCQEKIAALDARLELHNRHMEHYFWSSYANPGENIEEVKQRFFKNQPAASGSTYLVQLGCTKLLEDFNQLCAEHEITYWAAFGTLIGTVRHQGFIPWDDDLDLGLMRQDIEKLQEILKDSPTHRISVMYDPYVMCKQVRFTFADKTVPCFLDLFIFDCATTKESGQQIQDLREELMETMRKAPWYAEWLKQGCVNEGFPHAQEIQAEFDAFNVRALNEGITALNANEGPYMVRALENISGYAWCEKFENTFPLSWQPFETTQIAVPANALEVLEDSYGDIYALPADLHTHFDHIAGLVENQAEANAAIARVLAK
jgi:lipopolysaccharide cholinephosphotransferase